MTILSARSTRQLESAKQDIAKLAIDTSFSITLRWLAKDSLNKGYRYQAAILAEAYASEMAARASIDEMRILWCERAGLYFALAQEVK